MEYKKVEIIKMPHFLRFHTLIMLVVLGGIFLGGMSSLSAIRLAPAAVNRVFERMQGQFIEMQKESDDKKRYARIKTLVDEIKQNESLKAARDNRKNNILNTFKELTLKLQKKPSAAPVAPVTKEFQTSEEVDAYVQGVIAKADKVIPKGPDVFDAFGYSEWSRSSDFWQAARGDFEKSKKTATVHKEFISSKLFESSVTEGFAVGSEYLKEVQGHFKIASPTETHQKIMDEMGYWALVDMFGRDISWKDFSIESQLKRSYDMFIVAFNANKLSSLEPKKIQVFTQLAAQKPEVRTAISKGTSFEQIKSKVPASQQPAVKKLIEEYQAITRELDAASSDLSASQEKLARDHGFNIDVEEEVRGEMPAPPEAEPKSRGKWLKRIMLGLSAAAVLGAGVYSYLEIKKKQDEKKMKFGEAAKEVGQELPDKFKEGIHKTREKMGEFAGVLREMLGHGYQSMPESVRRVAEKAGGALGSLPGASRFFGPGGEPEGGTPGSGAEPDPTAGAAEEPVAPKGGEVVPSPPGG